MSDAMSSPPANARPRPPESASRAASGNGLEPLVLARLLEKLPYPVSYIDADLVYRQCNAAAAATIGLTPDQIVGETVASLVGAESEVVALLRGVLESGEPYTGTLEFAPPSPGQTSYYRAAYLPDIDDDGRTVGVLTNVTDVTELVQSEERFRAVQENSLDRFTILKPFFDEQGKVVDFTYVYQNARAAETTGRSPRELAGLRMTEVFPDFPQSRFFAMYKHVVDTGQAREFEGQYQADGVDDWFRATVTPIPDAIAIATQIVTEQKRVEEALQRQAEMIELSFDAIFVWQLGGAIESWNRGAEELYGFSKAEALGRVSHDLLATIHERPWPQIEAALHEHDTWEGEVRHRAKDGREVVVSSRLQLIRGDDGVERVMETNRDVTEHRLAEAERELLLEAAGALSGPVALADVLDTLARIILDIGGHTRVVISLWQEEPGRLTVARSRGQAALTEGMVVAIDDLSPPARQAIEKHETLVIDYDALEPERRGMGDRYTSHLALDVPLLFGGRFVGLLATDDPGERREFSNRQIRLIEGIAAHAAVVIENARVYQLEIATRMEQAAQEERSRLARDLHDSVTQALFAATLKAEALTLDDDSLSSQAYRVAEDVRRLNRGALAQMRTLLLELRGEPLEDVPVAQLLRHLVEAAEGRARVDVQLTMRGDAPLTPTLHVAVYRIVQEALNNVTRHAGASKAWVDLVMEPDALHLVVGDDGRGYEPSAFDPSHMGLRLMRERAEEVGAELSMVSELGRGTVVTLDWQRD